MNTVLDITDLFEKIPQRVRRSTWFGSRKKYLGARNPPWSDTKENRVSPWPEYTSNLSNQRFNREHFQGVQRVGSKLVLSGGISHVDAPGTQKASQLIVVEMGSVAEKTAWSLPAYGSSYKEPDERDLVVEVRTVHQTAWHAGGIQAIDSLVAVPVYASGQDSRIEFLDLEEEARILKPLETPGQSPKAVGIAPLADWLAHRYVMVVWDDVDLRFYFADTLPLDFDEADINSDPPRISVQDLPAGFLEGLQPSRSTYQMVNLVLNKTDSHIYMIAARSSEVLTPLIPGRDSLDLYRVRFIGNDLKRPHVEFVTSKLMYCYNKQCNFSAATGIYVHDEHHMFLYAASHWLHDGNKRINFNEYAF